MRILVALDGSENSLRAVKHALKIARLNPKTKVTGLYVGPSCYDLFPEPGVCTSIKQKELDKEIEERAQQAFDKIAEIVKKEGPAIEKAVARGDPAKAICRFVKEGGYDFVVIGSQGYGEMKNGVLGSVSHKVLHLCEAPVMIVK